MVTTKDFVIRHRNTNSETAIYRDTQEVHVETDDVTTAIYWRNEQCPTRFTRLNSQISLYNELLLWDLTET